MKQVWKTFPLLLLLVIFGGCNQSSKEAPEASSESTSAEPAPEPTVATSGYFKTPFQDESQFIVQTIVADIAEQIFYAKQHRLPDAKHFQVQATEKPDSPIGAPVYDLTIALTERSPLHVELKVNGPIWSPEIYKDVSKAVALSVGLEVPAKVEPAGTELLTALLDGTAETIEKQNQKISAALEANFTNAGLHEQAALLVGTFTLREHSGNFLEIRSPLCRITAHLALAQFLSDGKPLGLNGQISEVALYSLMNNQAAAVEKSRGIKTEDVTAKRWLKVLDAYNTGDYRPFVGMKGLALLERIAWFRAFAHSADADSAWVSLADNDKLVPDMARIVNEESYTVGVGHQLLRLSVPLELKEFGKVFELAHGRQLEDKGLIPQLNELPGRCFSMDGKTPKVTVIGWGHWAMFFQRQICHAIENNFDFMQNKWGVPDEAKKFSTKMDEVFGKLRLYPFVQRLNCTEEAAYRKSIDDCLNVTWATPHLCPAYGWNYIRYSVDFAKYYLPNPKFHINEWHKHTPPPGTAYNPYPRFDQASLLTGSDAVTRIRALHELAPYNSTISSKLLRLLYDQTPTYQQAQEIYKPVMPYAVYAMVAVAGTVKDQPERYEPLMASAATADPAYYYILGDYFKDRGLEGKTLKYYEKGSDLCIDAVHRSYVASWLVKQYLKQGETEKARKVAAEAGEVYSSVGLTAQAEFFEVTGDYSQAFDWYEKIEERYEDNGPLIAYCMRYKAKTGNGQFDGELQKRLGKVFPNGVEKANPNEFKAPPVDGVLVNEENSHTRQAGLKRGHVIVAINGTRVHSFKQYAAAREFNADPLMTLVVWKGEGYYQVQASPPNHRFGADFGDYPGK